VRITILGSGASSGTPAVDWGWGRCDPANPRNRRSRPSILVDDRGTRILVDTAPELRGQLLAAGVQSVDAVLYTHAHADHLHGIDDLRAVNRVRNAALPAYADAGTMAIVRERFAYVFEPLNAAAQFHYKPTLIPHIIENGDVFRVGRIRVEAFAQDHGYSTTFGFRFGRAAYTTDVVELSEKAFAVLEGIAVWIIGTLVDRPHRTHCDVDKALAWIRRIGPAKAVLSHLGNDLDYGRLTARLPAGVEAAYDGMVIEVPEA
jgi:phosphoribosyl 1,2-cyclic phosphate phosphodiesterase